VWEGVLFCAQGIEIHVHKLQDVKVENGSHIVRTTEYSYQVLRRDDEDTVLQLFRYDNAHAHAGDPTPHHKHTFRPNGEEVITHVGEDWPTLAQVIEEAEARVDPAH
jgi:hypothetical protein